MKLIIAMIPHDSAAQVVDALTRQEFGVTRINTFSGFMRRGNATLLVGVDDEHLGTASDIMSAATNKGRFYVFDVDRYERI